MQIKKIFITIITATTFACAATCASIKNSQNIIIFGDSLSDMGNNTWVTGEGVSGAPITNKPTESPRLLWPNLLVATLNSVPAQADNPTLYSENKNADPLRDNINYAYASAETGDNYLNDLDQSNSYPPYVNCTAAGSSSAQNACVPGVITQIKYYLNAVHNVPNKNTAFVIWAGGNDFFNDVSKLISSAQGNTQTLSNDFTKLADVFTGHSGSSFSGPQLSKPIANLKTAINMLMSSGVSRDNIYIFNLPDMSKTPAAIKLANGNKLILDALNMLSGVYNFSLQSRLSGKNMLDAKHIFKINKLFKTIEHDKTVDAQYDLHNFTGDCVADKQAQACSGYVFYNDKHPTFNLERFLSDNFVQQNITQ